MNRTPWWQRVGWLFVLWAASVGALTGVAYAIRMLMHAAGLTTG